MICRIKLRIKVPDDLAATDKRRSKILKLIEKHDGKNGTPNPRAHVVGIFREKDVAKAFRKEAQDFLGA